MLLLVVPAVLSGWQRGLLDVASLFNEQGMFLDGAVLCRSCDCSESHRLSPTATFCNPTQPRLYGVPGVLVYYVILLKIVSFVVILYRLQCSLLYSTVHSTYIMCNCTDIRVEKKKCSLIQRVICLIFNSIALGIKIKKFI